MKVSIITPTYNSEEFIASTIESVLAQTHSNWEMLITDDDSSDRTTEVVKRFIEKDKRIKLFELDENKGPAKARNNSIEHAQGSYLAFLDADDIWFDFHLKNSIHFAQTHNAPFVFASYKRYDENLNPRYSDFIVPKKVTYTDILKTNSISCLTALIDIKCLGKKYMPDIKKRQDMGLWLAYLKDCGYAYGIAKPHAIYRIRNHSLSRNKLALLSHQWRFYRDVEKMGVLSAIYFMLCWMCYGLLKYKN